MKCKIDRLLKYLLMLLLSISNNLIYVFIQSYLIVFIQNTDDFSIETNSLKISLVLSSYDIFRIIFSYAWDILKDIVGIHIPITISLFLLALCNILFNYTIMSSLLYVMIIRIIIGVFNPLPMYSMISFCEMFSVKEQKKIGHIVNFIKNLCGTALMLASAFIPFKKYQIITFAIGMINLLTALLYMFQFKCQVRFNNLYEFQENDIEISKNNSCSQSNSIYIANPKIRNPNTDNNFNNINPKGNRSIDFFTNKNFKQLNSESIDNNLDQINKITGKECGENGKISSFVNRSLDKQFSNIPAQTHIERKANVPINGDHKPQKQKNNNVLPRVLSTNQTNQTTPKEIHSQINRIKKKNSFEDNIGKGISFLIINILNQSNYYLLFFTFLIKISYSSKQNKNALITSTNDILPFHSCLLISVYYFCFIVFTPINNCILNYMISANDPKKRIRVYHIISICALITTIVYYAINYFLPWDMSKIIIYLQFSFLILRNQILLLLTSCINISILHLKKTKMQERYSKHQKKACVLISYILISILIFINYFFVENNIIVLVSFYLVPLLLLLIAYILGIVHLF